MTLPCVCFSVYYSSTVSRRPSMIFKAALRQEAHALLAGAAEAGRLRFVGNLEAGDAMLGRRMALRMARASEEPWALMTGLEMPRKGVAVGVAV